MRVRRSRIPPSPPPRAGDVIAHGVAGRRLKPPPAPRAQRRRTGSAAFFLPTLCRTALASPRPIISLGSLRRTSLRTSRHTIPVRGHSAELGLQYERTTGHVHLRAVRMTPRGAVALAVDQHPSSRNARRHTRVREDHVDVVEQSPHRPLSKHSHSNRDNPSNSNNVHDVARHLPRRCEHACGTSI